MADDKTKPRWYNAWATPAGTYEKFKHVPGGLYFYVRKSHVEGSVTVWNGRHYITTLSVEDAKKYLERGKVAANQEELDKEYNWYLNY